MPEALESHAIADGQPQTAKACFGFILAGLIWLALEMAGLLGPAADYTFVLIAVGTVAASQVGLRRYRPTVRWPWNLLAASLVVFLAGGAVRQAVGSYGDLTPSRSLLPDYIVLPGYVLVALAVAGFIRSRSRRKGHNLDAVLDSAIVSLAALTLAWVYLITPALFDAQTTLKVRLSLAIYPPLSVFIAALAARVSFTSGQRMSVAQRLLMSMMIFMVVGDVAATIGDAHLASVPKSLADLPYALAFLSLGATYLHPSMRQLSDEVPSDDTSPMRGRLLLIVAGLAIPAIISQIHDGGTGRQRGVLAGIVLALTGVAILRVARALRQQAASEARLTYQATHDELTGLPNRAMLLEHIERAIKRSAATSTQAAVLFVDLDRFKVVNDTSGHAVGDELLIAVGARLRAAVADDDIVGRLGGDEYVVILDRVHGISWALQAAEDLQRAFMEPFTIRDLEVFSTLSIGLVLVDAASDDGEAEELLQNADTAMYQVKAAGGDGVAVFDGAMRNKLQERITLERDLRKALERGELQAYYQPIVSLHDEHVEGFEALLRWFHSERGLIPPSTFIPIAEESGLILEIGTWVLCEAVRQMAAWRSSGALPRHLYVAVNLSARQLRDPQLIAKITGAMALHSLPASALCLELTESLLMDDPDAATEILNEIRSKNIALSIDDFGTGYSSLSYLRRLPVDYVKIDKSFVDGLEGDDSSEESLVAAIIAMAKALKKSTIAEGVESVRQARRLRAMGATRAQGYLYSRPLAPDVVVAAVASINNGRHLSVGPKPAEVEPASETLTLRS